MKDEITELVIRPKMVLKKEKIVQKLSWYDWTNDIQYEDEGGEIRWHYDRNAKRMIPYVMDAYHNKRENNYKEIKQSLNDFDIDHILISDIPNREIVIGVNSDLVEEMENNLDRKGINYEVHS